MGPWVWKAISAGAALGAAAVAERLVSTGWRAVSGHAAPDDPTHIDEVSWKEAIAFAALTGLVVSAARVVATRWAAHYYQKSAGHLPAAYDKDDR